MFETVMTVLGMLLGMCFVITFLYYLYRGISRGVW